MNNIDDDICFENIEIFESSKFKKLFVKFDDFYQLKIQFFNRNICQNYFKTKINRIFFKKFKICLFLNNSNYVYSEKFCQNTH